MAKKVKVCVLRIEGTNGEDEMAKAFELAGASSEIVHLNQLSKIKGISKKDYRDLKDYDILMIPGGFSAADSVRAGAILAARIKTEIGKEIKTFVESEKPVGGICNGFQVLVELGLLPALSDIMTNQPEVALVTNARPRFECRPVMLKHVNKGKCIWTDGVKDLTIMPIAHGEGRFTLPPGKEKEMLKQMIDDDQIVFRYAQPDGEPAHGKFPFNPNGALHDIAGICNPKGNVFGMMPHPERIVDKFQNPEWTKNPDAEGFGLAVFKSVVEHVKNSKK